jgi:V-type H+-transporting ATPase subunit a
MSIFRSENISHKSMRIAKDQAVEVLSEIGKMKDTVEFIDLNKKNPEDYKNFNPLIKRCDEIERKITGFENLCYKHNINLTQFKNYKDFDSMLTEDINSNLGGDLQYFDYVENIINEDFKQTNELIQNTVQITDILSKLVEKKNVYEVCSKLTRNNHMREMNNQIDEEEKDDNEDQDHDRNNMFHVGGSINSNNPRELYIDESNVNDISMTTMSVIAGVIRSEDTVRIKRMIFRVSRARAMITFFDFPDYERYILNEVSLFGDQIIQNSSDSSKSQQKDTLTDRNMIGNKSIFVIFFPSSSTDSILYSKVLKVCDLFSASRYSIPKSNYLMKKMEELDSEIKSNVKVTKEINNSIINFIHERGGNGHVPSKYELYKIYARKEKMIYTALSKCILRDHFIDAEIYVHSKKFDVLVENLHAMYKDQESKSIPVFEDMPMNEATKLPTLIKTNEFTMPFQQIVNTYGIPRYGEVNPALFNIITFPFLFGIMFGDIGHGGLLLTFALYLCFNKLEILKSDSGPLKLFLKARYLLLLMGICSFYMGWIYDDFFALPVGLFGKSCYENVFNTKAVQLKNGTITIETISGYGQRKNENCVYPIGIDPKWYSSSNELAFMNSFKMKISVIFGVTQMLMGIMLKGLNSLHFKNYLDFFLEFIPQFIFMFALFGYMNIMIFIKWATDWSKSATSPPSIITLLLNIFLKGGSVEGKPLYGDTDGSTQETIHLIILCICLLCIPIMLIPKPIILYIKQNKSENLIQEQINNPDPHNKVIINIFKLNFKLIFYESFIDFRKIILLVVFLFIKLLKQ